MAAAKTNPHADAYRECLATAESHLADRLPQTTRVEHALEVALVHALAGAKDDAEEALETAEGLIEERHPATVPLEGFFALARARVHAVLSR